MDRDIIYGNISENREVDKFKASLAYEQVVKYIELIDAKIQESEILGDTEQEYDLVLQSMPKTPKAINKLLLGISRIIENVPLEEDDQRYGNKGFIKFIERVKAEGEGLIKSTVFNGKPSKDVEILQKYLQASFGNQTRIDYGTGHELNFFCFLIVLHIREVVPTDDLFVALEQYFSIVRMLILKYKLEPAGSHGIWGIDDYQLLPFLFGSSQFCRRTDLVFTSLFESKYKHLCIGKALRFIHVHKTYPPVKYTYQERIEEYSNVQITEEPFARHSPMIYALKDTPFTKINKGMIKMYHSVVLSKYVVIQHFIGSEYLPI